MMTLTTHHKSAKTEKNHTTARQRRIVIGGSILTIRKCVYNRVERQQENTNCYRRVSASFCART